MTSLRETMLRKFKKQYLWAIATLLLIPLAVVLSGVVFALIDPELAHGHENYTRNYRILETLRSLSMLAGLLVCLGLWSLACYLIVTSKQLAIAWTLLAALGPFGLIVLMQLRDRAPLAGDSWQQFLLRLRLGWRVLLELAIFIGVWLLAFETVAIWRELTIRITSARSGVPVEKIVALQTASSGMHAFGEMLEVLFLVPLFYLLWPVLFNVLAHYAAAKRSAEPRP